VRYLELDERVDRVLCLVRQAGKRMHPKVEYREIDFNRLDQQAELFRGVDAVICCIGTTIKVAKTREQFRFVDFDIPFQVAVLAREAGVRCFSLVSSVGALKESRSFYLQVKGELEEALQQLAFPVLYVFRPSLLLGNRTEFRLGERFMVYLFTVFSFLIPRSYRATDSDILAQMIVERLWQDVSGVDSVEARDIC